MLTITTATLDVRYNSSSFASFAGETKAKVGVIALRQNERGRGRCRGGACVLLIAASILAARRLAQLDHKPSPAIESRIADAISDAEKIMRRIDRDAGRR